MVKKNDLGEKLVDIAIYLMLLLQDKIENKVSKNKKEYIKT